MKIDFTKLPVGTKVWDVTRGWGVIKALVPQEAYPVCVYFDGDVETYTENGKLDSFNSYPTLFLNEFKIPDEAYRPPRPDLKVDDKVIVWDDESRKHHRHFKRWTEDGKIECFGGGETSWSNDRGGSSEWRFYEVQESDTV